MNDGPSTHPVVQYSKPIELMTTTQIAERLVALCRESKYEQAQRELYADDAVSLEPEATPMFEQETRGLPAIIEKGRKFSGMIETLHGNWVSDPLVAAHSFACTMRLDLTLRGHGRMVLSELCVYTAKNGKVTSERFFT